MMAESQDRIQKRRRQLLRKSGTDDLLIIGLALEIQYEAVQNSFHLETLHDNRS